MNNRVIIQVVILGALAIAGILAFQVYWLMKSLNTREAKFHQTVNIALKDVAHQIFEYNQSTIPRRDLIKQVSSNYYVVDIRDKINANTLEFYLLQEFENHNLNVDFEYGIYDCSSDKMVHGNYCPAIDDPDKEFTISSNLPKYEEFDYYFGVSFPSKRFFLLRDMTTSIGLAIITLLAIIFFIYTILVILKQKRLSEMQKDFINNMTHEFKTPISSIKLSSDVLISNEAVRKDSRLLRYAHIIKDQNEHLNLQVEKVLNIARLDRDQFDLNLVTLDFNQLVQRAANEAEIKVSEKGGSLNLNLDLNVEMIKADKIHLANVLNNLFDNAIKYSNGSPKIEVKTTKAESIVSFSITDKGQGLSKEQQTKIFNKFYRVPTGDVHNIKGFGLGLFYVKTIVESHGWKIEVDSAIDQGSTFNIKIPVA